MGNMGLPQYSRPRCALRLKPRLGFATAAPTRLRKRHRKHPLHVAIFQDALFGYLVALDAIAYPIDGLQNTQKPLLAGLANRIAASPIRSV